MTQTKGMFQFYDLKPTVASFRDEVLHGLQQSPKEISSKFFYNERGSKLYDQICHLDEYYPARTEISVLTENAPAIADAVGPGAAIVEYGSGSSNKTMVVLKNCRDIAAYLPIDISREHLHGAAKGIAEKLPHLNVLPICADFTKPMEYPELPVRPERWVAYFPGGTIGNFPRERARTLLSKIAREMGPGGGLVVGVDLQKDPAVIEAAYNDREGVTAAFNRNLLRRMNEELGADFDLDRFRHKAVYLTDEGRIEMRLYSEGDQTVHIDNLEATFADGEYLLTEYSCKYTLEGFASQAEAAGFRVEEVWTDPKNYFSVQYLIVG